MLTTLKEDIVFLFQSEIEELSNKLLFCEILETFVGLRWFL